MSTLPKHIARFATAVFVSVGAATASLAATLDFTTATYDSTFGSVPGDNVATDTVDGVNFTITATSQGAWGFRQAPGRGLQFGVPGNGMRSVSIVADQDLVYNSMFGNGHGLTQYAGQLPFNVSVDGVDVSVGNMFGSTGLEALSFAGGPIAVDAGQEFLLYVDFGSLVGSSIFASARVKSIDFSIASVTPVPLPAGLPLLIGGLGVLGFVRSRKKPA